MDRVGMGDVTARRIPFTAELEKLEVPRTARYARLGSFGPSIREVWYVLHGYGQRAVDFLRPFRRLESKERVIVAPEAMSRFYLAPMDRPHGRGDRVGASWMTREDRDSEIQDYVRYLELVRERVEGSREPDPTPRIVLGFSQGCHTAARWAMLGKVPPDVLILWGAAFPRDPELESSRFRDTRVLLVRGRDDPQRRPEEEEDEERRLVAAGIPYEVRRHPADHRIHRATLEEIAAEVV